jgi:putative transposase
MRQWRMPRHARIDLPGLPTHVCIRSVNGMPFLATDLERNVFLMYLRMAMEGHDFRIHAFVLMTNHVHLLVTTGGKGVMAEVMRSLTIRFARFFNAAHDRKGPLLQGRFWSSPIESEGYFYWTMRYIELNPVRAGMVLLPDDFPWSSYGHNTGGARRVEIVFHDQYLRLGSTPAERAKAWAAFVRQGINQDELDRMRRRFRQNRPLGSSNFERRFKPDPTEGTGNGDGS